MSENELPPQTLSVLEQHPSAQSSFLAASFSDNSKIAKDFIEDARKKCQQKNYDGAIKDCLEAIEINPFYSRAHRQHGMALYLNGNLDDAETAWKKAWECDCRR